MLSGIAKVAKRSLTSAPTRAFAQSAKIKIPPLQGSARFDEKLYPTETTLTADQALKYYTDMTTIRKMEVACDNMYKNREIRGFCHLADGQEAIAVGIEAAVTYDDPLITAYRDHGQIYMRGDSVFQIIAEMLGKSAGSSKGKGGSMHYYRAKNNFYGGNGIVGAQLPVGTGLAFALKYQKKKNCSIAMYGDGSANQGQLFEAANMAKLWSLPVVYVCENNRYGMGTSVSRASANTKFYERLELVPGVRVDGFNILSVRESMAMAKKFCVEGKGPICIEYSTYRYHGHSMSDPGISYRKREEIQDIRAKQDCILQMKNLILDNKLADENKLKEIDKQVKDIVDKAVEDARAAPYPKPEEVYADIYTEKDSFFIRGVEWEKSVFVDGKAT